MTGQRELFDDAMRQGHAAAWDQQWDRAIGAYRQALQQFPDEPNALASLGFALLQSDQLDAALRAYQRAATLNPGDPVAPEKCGEIFERQGRLNDAALTYLAVAEIHLRRRDVPKAIANWQRVVRLTPDNLSAHSRLALASERTGRPRDAAREYLEVARIFQRARDSEKALAAAQRAAQLDPQSAEARDALDKLRRGLPLPLPEHPAASPALPIGAGVLASLDELEIAPPLSPNGADHHESPLADAQDRAISNLAELLFEEDTELAKKAGGLNVLTRGTGKLSGDRARRALATRHLGQAISSYTAGDEADAIRAFDNALHAGLESPVVSFVLGGLYLRQKRLAEAIRHFGAALHHDDVALGALYGLAQAEQQSGQVQPAVTHLLDALRRLDQQFLPPDRHDAVAEAYESLAEGLRHSPAEELAPLAASLTSFLTGEGWLTRVEQARRQLDTAALDGQVAPLADLLAVPGASDVVESLRRIETCMGRRLYAAALEEAYFALGRAPTHLPIHIRIAEILTAEQRTQAAIDKYVTIAETYRVRGDLARATRIIHQVLRLSPLDVTQRAVLIELLVQQSQIDPALQQFLDLGETYYQLADLESARTTYADALLLAQQHHLDHTWSVALLHKMGDIDLQRLNWREAQHVYEQIKALAPHDAAARATLIDLLFRLGQPKQALAEADNYLRGLLAERQTGPAIELLAELVETHPQESGLIARLARLYQDTGRRAEAIIEYDRLGEMQLQSGQTAQAAETVRTILSLGPEDPRPYEQLLQELHG